MIGWFIFGVIIIDEETIMDIVGAMLKYMEVKDKRILVKNIQISDYELTVVVVKILSWLKLEHKRSIWISQGKRKRFKPLEIDMRYPWCANLYKLVENESLFQDCFLIKNSKFSFLDSVSEEDRRKAREKAYQNYNPQKCT
jgi:hypothetical protein